MCQFSHQIRSLHINNNLQFANINHNFTLVCKSSTTVCAIYLISNNNYLLCGSTTFYGKSVNSTTDETNYRTVWEFSLLQMWVGFEYRESGMVWPSGRGGSSFGSSGGGVAASSSASSSSSCSSSYSSSSSSSTASLPFIGCDLGHQRHHCPFIRPSIHANALIQAAPAFLFHSCSLHPAWQQYRTECLERSASWSWSWFNSISPSVVSAIGSVRILIGVS